MKRSLKKVLISGMTLPILLLGFTNCARGPSASILDSTGDGLQSSNSIAPGSSLAGTGLTRDLAAGCPASTPDFMDKEVGTARRIQPRNCLILKMATPVMSWVQPTDFQTGSSFGVHISAESPTTNHWDYTYFPKIPRLLVTATLMPGTYRWTVSYTNKSGTLVTSQARRFIIPEGKLYSIPTPEAFANSVLAISHPRIQPTGADHVTKISFPTIAARARAAGYQPSLDNYLAYASSHSLSATIPSVPPNKTPADFASSNDYDAWLTTLRHQILDERLAIENLAFAFYFTGNTTYREKAIAHLQSLAAWPTTGATSEVVQDQVNREIFLILAMGLDLFQDKLNETAYQPIRNAMIATYKNRIAQVDFNSLNRYPYNSHLLTAVNYALESILYVAGTPGFANDGGKSLLMSYWENAMTTFGTWGGDSDGGYANGGGYGWYATDSVARLMATTKLMANVDLTAWPVAASFGYGPLALTAPLTKIREQFGDEADWPTHYNDYSGDTSRMMALLTGKPEFEWYWRVLPTNVTNKWLFTPIHFLLAGASTTLPVAPTTAPQIANSFIFEDAGIVAMHSNTTDPNRTSVFFRSSRFGSFNHSHADQNAFTFVSKGKDLLISGGVYDYFGSAFHSHITRATRFKNALTFDGGIGQAEPSLNPTTPGNPYESLDANGRLVNYYDDGNWAITTGDATKAYQGRDMNTGAMNPLLSGAFRTVAYNRKERVVVIYDWARSSKIHKWELNFQTLATTPPTVSGLNFKVQNGTSNACVKVWGPDGYFEIFPGWEGLTPGRASDAQSHVRFSVRNNTQEFTAVTVIREDCRDLPVGVTFAGPEAYVNINGSRLTLDGLVVKTQ